MEMYNESEVDVKEEIKTHIYNDNEIKVEVIEGTYDEDYFHDESVTEQYINEDHEKSNELISSPLCFRSKANVLFRPQLSRPLHPEETISGAWQSHTTTNVGSRETNETLDDGDVNQEDILIKEEEIKSENHDELLFLQQDLENDQPTSSQANISLQPQMLYQLVRVPPRTNFKDVEAGPSDDCDLISRFCEEPYMEKDNLELSLNNTSTSALPFESKSHSTDKIHKTKLLLCKICERTFSTQDGLTKHTQIVHDRLTRHECYFCCKRFFNLANLFRHIRLHTTEQPFTCSICGSKFVRANNLTNHIKAVHERVRNFRCTFKDCHFQCALKTNLAKHIKVHTKERPFKCDICGLRFTENCSLKTHMKGVHEGIKRLKFKCTSNGCVYRFSKKSELAQHIKIHPGATLPTFQCEICKKIFMKKPSLKKHQIRKCKFQTPPAPDFIPGSEQNR